MKAIVLVNRKGGVAKTTLTGHLAVAAELAGDGPVAVIDTDPQASLAKWWDIRKAETPIFINATLDDGSFVLRASDRVDATLDPQTRIELTIVGSDESKLRRIFDALSDGGTVKAHLEKMFWGDIFGALVDKFGIGWQVNIAAG